MWAHRVLCSSIMFLEIHKRSRGPIGAQHGDFGDTWIKTSLRVKGRDRKKNNEKQAGAELFQAQHS